jgi:ferredoxin, 2Fe-2S
MAGVNPYIQKLPMNRPTKPYTVTFIDEATGERKTYRMDPATFPFGEIGLDGSLLAIAQEAGVEINHSCGGVCACSTCHVYVTKGKELLTEAEEDEEDILDKAFDVKATSRLGCQATIAKDGDLECEITRESLDAFYNEHPQEKDPRKSH